MAAILEKGSNHVDAPKKRSPWLHYWDFYLMLLPAMIFIVVYKYVPMYGVIIAFKDFNIMEGIPGSPWVGLQHFRELFMFEEFPRVVNNTVIISLMKLVFGFPAPLIIALLLNELVVKRFKRVVQTLTYIPHFISWVVVGGIVIDVLSPSSGIVNKVIQLFGFDPIFFMSDERLFRWVLVFSDIWKEAGWGAIIYLAALLGINDELYQAAKVDGASRIRQIWHVTLPCIRSTITILLLLRIGNVFDAGFEQILVMYNTTVYSVADIIDTYVFRVGLGQMQFGLTTAAGLFKSVIGCGLLLIANWIARRLGEDGIF